MIKRFLIGFTVLISIFLFTNKASAEENAIIDCSNGEFSNYCSGTFTSDDLNSIIELNNIDTSVYSNVLLIFNYKDRSKFNYFYIFFYSSESQINFYNENNIFIDGPALYLTFSKYKGLVDLSSLNYSNVTSLTNVQMQLIFTTKSIAYNGPISDISNTSSPNEFKETINSLKYSKIELIFDIPNKETNFNFNYDFHLVDSNGDLDTLNTFKSPYFEETYTSCSVDESGVGSCKPLPIVDNFVIKKSNENDGQCHLDEFGLNNCYKPNDYSNNDELNISNSYLVQNYDMVINNNTLTKITTKLKLIIDLEFNSSVYIDASFTSSLPFEVKYYERTTTTDYYSTIDITGKYGALFMPKFDNLDDTLNIRTLFKGDGHLDIQHRSSIDLINYKILSAYSMNYCNEYLYNQDKIPYSCSEFSGEFEFYVSNNNLEQGLFFVNSHFDNDNSASATITYDTRYYVYWVFDTPSSIVSVENPNTGNKEYISLDGFYNYADVDPGFLESLFNKFTEQLYDTFPVIQQFLMVINLFDYNEEYDEAPKLMVSLDSIGIDQEVQIVDFGVFHEHRSTLIFWEMLFITTITVIKVTDNVVKAMKD